MLRPTLYIRHISVPFQLQINGMEENFSNFSLYMSSSLYSYDYEFTQFVFVLHIALVLCSCTNCFYLNFHKLFVCRIHTIMFVVLEAPRRWQLALYLLCSMLRFVYLYIYIPIHSIKLLSKNINRFADDKTEEYILVY